jgi:2-methylisocitrate lyase-like PEP mutase family enzyme
MELKSAPEVLRNRLASGLLVVPGAFNALTARMVQDAGFDAVYATGAGIANAYLGVPDVGLLTQTEMAAHARAMVRATKIPVLVDVDTGYGGVHNTVRTVQEMEAAGAAAIQIEDQSFPKRCGHFDRKSVVPTDEMVAKILAAVDTRRSDIVLIARTDAIAVNGFDDAVQRARLYREAGADIIFVEALESVDQIRELPGLVDAPLLINMVEGGLTPFLSPGELDRLGYSIVAFANFGLRATMKALRESLHRLKEAGTSAFLVDDIMSWDERQAVVGLDGYDKRESVWLEKTTQLLARLMGNDRPTGGPP